MLSAGECESGPASVHDTQGAASTSLTRLLCQDTENNKSSLMRIWNKSCVQDLFKVNHEPLVSQPWKGSQTFRNAGLPLDTSASPRALPWASLEPQPHGILKYLPRLTDPTPTPNFGHHTPVLSWKTQKLSLQAGGETAVIPNGIWTFESIFLRPISSYFFSQGDLGPHGGRGRVFWPARWPDMESSGTSFRLSLDSGRDFTHEVGGELWVNSLCQTYNKVYLTDCRVIFKEGCLLEIFRICRQKQRPCWTPKTLWHDNTWRFLNSQLFSLRAICSAFLIIPCLPGTMPVLSPAICKLNIFWLISIFFLWATRQYFI